MNLHISLATLDDIPALNRLLHQLFSQEEEFVPNPHHQSLALKQIIQEPNTGVIFAAKPNDQVVGMVSLLYTLSTALGGRVALLEDMVVDAHHQNQGIGKTLLTHAIEYAKTHNIQRITLLTDNGNTKAQSFYRSFGFQGSPMIPMRLILD